MEMCTWDQLPVDCLAFGAKNAYKSEVLTALEGYRGDFSDNHPVNFKYWEERRNGEVWRSLADFSKNHSYNPLDYMISQVCCSSVSSIPTPDKCMTGEAERRYFKFVGFVSKQFEAKYRLDLYNLKSTIWDCQNYLNYSPADALGFAMRSCNCMPLSCLFIYDTIGVDDSNEASVSLLENALLDAAVVSYAHRRMGWESLIGSPDVDWSDNFMSKVLDIRSKGLNVRRSWCGLGQWNHAAV